VGERGEYVCYESIKIDLRREMFCKDRKHLLGEKDGKHVASGTHSTYSSSSVCEREELLREEVQADDGGVAAPSPMEEKGRLQRSSYPWKTPQWGEKHDTWAPLVLTP